MSDPSFSSIDYDRSSGPMSPGIYTFLIENVEEKQGNAGPYLTLHLRCADQGREHGKIVWHNLSLTPQSRWKMDEFLDALGAPATGQGTGRKFMGKYVRAQIYNEKFTNDEGVTRDMDKVNLFMAGAQAPAAGTVATPMPPAPTAPEIQNPAGQEEIPF